jgi:hypothetical protein
MYCILKIAYFGHLHQNFFQNPYINFFALLEDFTKQKGGVNFNSLKKKFTYKIDLTFFFYVTLRILITIYSEIVNC